MGLLNPTLSRISKIWTDRDSIAPDAALARRQNFAVTLVCGADVAGSPTLQIAVLTAARLAVRCFPGAIRAVVPTTAQNATLRIGSRSVAFGAALAEIVSAANIASSGNIHGNCVIFGNAVQPEGGIRVTFDGWIAAAGPISMTPRMPEREFCRLSGVLAASLAISELFMSFADVTVQAGRRRVALSLWRPDLSPDANEALGVPINVVPSSAWILGLGHLGNAYLWALAAQSTNEPTRLFLNDFDVVEETNVETGVLFDVADVGMLKTRVLARKLEGMGFETRLVERKFDQHFRTQAEEPLLAFCGFDSNAARRNLETAGFKFVVESGLGGQASNFDVISLHTLPNERSGPEMWPDPDNKVLEQEARRIAANNPAYTLVTDDECGRVTIAGKSIAVPFVGTTAAALVVSEALRVLHGGPAFGHLKIRLATPEEGAFGYIGDHKPESTAGLHFSALKVGSS
jgi:hypothetical protein